jgi:hypothetical protein
LFCGGAVPHRRQVSLSVGRLRLSLQLRNLLLQLRVFRFKPCVRLAQSGFIIQFKVLISDIPGERVTVHPRSDAEKDIGIGDGRKRDHFATLNHRRQIHKILDRLQVEFFDLGNLRRQEPASLFVVPQLCWDFD